MLQPSRDQIAAGSDRRKGTATSAKILSATQEGLPPAVERVLLVAPPTDGFVIGHNHELRGELDPIAVRIVDEQEQIVARSVAARPPFDGGPKFGKAIAPIADRVPVRDLITVMIQPALR